MINATLRIRCISAESLEAILELLRAEAKQVAIVDEWVTPELAA